MKLFLEELVAFVGERHLPLLFVEAVHVVGQLRQQIVDRGIKLAPVVGGARDDQRRARLVDEDGVDLVDDGVVMLALVHVGEFRLHVVAQVVEAELVVGPVGDVGLVGGALFLFGLLGIDDAGGHPEHAVDLAHPLGVAPGEVVVDGDDVHALAGQRVQIDREGRDQGLALTGLHLGDVALVQEDAAHQLDVECPQPKRALAGLAAIGEGLGQQVVEALAICEALLQFVRLALDGSVAHRLDFGLERIDLFDDRPGRLDLAVVRRPEDLLGDSPDTQHDYSDPVIDDIVRKRGVVWLVGPP